jgi:nucleotide-binding universal stress UspA family protein
MKVLLAVDRSDSSEAAARAIAEQFRAEDTEVYVLHTLMWQRAISPCFTFARGGSYGTQLRSMMNNAREQAKALVTKVAEILRASGFRTRTAVVEGSPSPIILDRAAEWNADLIVLGSNQRNTLDRALFGSIAERIVRRAPCSVEVVRPHSG